MSEPLQEASESDAMDWKASEFGDDDYVSDDTVDEMVEDVADGTQTEAPGDDEGWASPPGDDESPSERRVTGLTRAQMLTIAQRTGFPVRAAWVGGHGPMGKVLGVMMHHTATPDSAEGDFPTLGVVTKGRTGLSGPLCNYGLGRSGTIYLVSDGRAYHAGRGHWKGITSGNTHFLGVEAENAGTGKAWPAVHLDAYQRLVASILHALGRDTNWDIRHGTWAVPGGRKVDTKGFVMRDFDARVRQMLAAPATINRNHRP